MFHTGTFGELYRAIMSPINERAKVHALCHSGHRELTKPVITVIVIEKRKRVERSETEEKKRVEKTDRAEKRERDERGIRSRMQICNCRIFLWTLFF